MAKVKYGVALGDNTDITTYYSSLKLEHASKSEVVYEDPSSHADIELHGSGLAVDKHGIISKGMIDEIDFNDANGKSLAELDVGHNEPKIDAAGARDAYVNAGVLGLMMYVFKGNDTFVGSKHGDWINSWDGNDKVNGTAAMISLPAIPARTGSPAAAATTCSSSAAATARMSSPISTPMAARAIRTSSGRWAITRSSRTGTTRSSTSTTARR